MYGNDSQSASKSVQYGTEKVEFDDAGAKAVIELWFEFVGDYIFAFMWQSSQSAAAEMDRRKFLPLSRTVVGSR